MVEVRAASLRHVQPGSFVEKWSSEDLVQNQGASVADLLQQKTGIYFKSYGLGSLSTTSIRGASASQTAVLWNGLQIQSPMLGLLDWSLLPVQFTDEVSFQHGGNTAAWGSGAIGGAVLMDNQPKFDQKGYIKLQAGLGSFGWQHQGLNLGYGNSKWAFSSRFFHQKADNDFPYKPAPNLPTTRLANAQQWRFGQMASAHWRPNSRQVVGLLAWWQKADRQIPPTLVQNVSEAKLIDDQLRTALTWEQNGKKGTWSAKAAFFNDKNLYLDNYSKVSNENRFWTGIAEVNHLRVLNKASNAQFVINHQSTNAQTKHYGSARHRHQTAAFASLRHRMGKWTGQIDGRLELADGQLLPFTPSLGVDWMPVTALKIEAKISRHFRLPTLNDLHWRPGGNPDLKPESGWGEEFNLRFFKAVNGHKFNFTTAVFNRKIQDWIQWRPLAGQPIWSASNIEGVWSRGVEARSHWTFEQGLWQFQLNLGYDLVRSTHQAALSVPVIEKGQQLYYVPENQGFIGSELKWQNFAFSYRHQFFDAVLTEYGSLAGYQIGAVSLNYSTHVLGQATNFSLSIENSWNTDYQVVERRPMPGRSWQIGVSTLIAKH